MNTPPAAKVLTERQKFEAWLKPQYHAIDALKRGDSPATADQYYFADTALAWRTWQAALASRAAEGEPRNYGLDSLGLWWTMIEAERELSGEQPLADTDVILHYMGCGASTQVTAQDIRAALASPVAAALPAQTERPLCVRCKTRDGDRVVIGTGPICCYCATDDEVEL